MTARVPRTPPITSNPSRLGSPVAWVTTPHGLLWVGALLWLLWQPTGQGSEPNNAPTVSHPPKAHPKASNSNAPSSGHAGVIDPNTAPDFMAALKKAVAHSEALIAHTHTHIPLASLDTHAEPSTRLKDFKTVENSNDWWGDNHMSLVGGVSGHDGTRTRVSIKNICIQESDTFCDSVTQSGPRDPSLLLNGFADLRVALGANIGVNVKF